MLYRSVRTLVLVRDGGLCIGLESRVERMSCLVLLKRPHVSVSASLPWVTLCNKHPTVLGMEQQRWFTFLPNVCLMCTMSLGVPGLKAVISLMWALCSWAAVPHALGIMLFV